jgi:NAD-dependent DNA ligase
MHSKKPDRELASVVDFVAYEQIEPRVKVSTALDSLKRLKFSVVYSEEIRSKDLTMENLSTILIKRRKDSEYEVDGIVIYHNAEYSIVRGKNPDYAFAFKSILTHEEAEVTIKRGGVERVERRVSKTDTKVRSSNSSGCVNSESNRI